MEIKRHLKPSDVLVCTVLNQIVHPKVISIILHEIKFWIVIGSGSLKLFERLCDRLGYSRGWVSSSVTLKLQGAKVSGDRGMEWIDVDRSEETDDVDLGHDAALSSRSFEFAGGMVR